MSNKQKNKPAAKPQKVQPHSSIAFSLSRWFRKAATNAPTTFIVTAIGIFYAVFLFGGGLYTLIMQPAASGYYSGQFLFLAPGLSSQYGSDTLITVILYLLGFTGLMAIYQSTKNVNKPRQAYMLLIIGASFLLISYIFLESAILVKSSYG
jgi:hypothetical protein